MNISGGTFRNGKPAESPRSLRDNKRKSASRKTGSGGKLFFAGVILLLAVGSGSTAEVPVPGAVDDPGKLAEAAVLENRSMEAKRNRIEAFEKKVGAARAWNDPVLSAEFSNFPIDSWSAGESPMSGVQFKIAQKIPLPGKNRHQMEIARRELSEKTWELEEKKNRLRHLVRKTYWNLAQTRELKKITSRHAAAAGRLASIARAGYRAGRSDQYDLLSLKLVENKLVDDLGDFRQRETALTAVLNAALHREESAPFTTPADIAPIAPDLTLGELLELAEEFNPRLKEAEAKSLRFREAAMGAALARWPDITAWGGYRARFPAGADNGTDMISLGIAAALPFDYTSHAEFKRAGFLLLENAETERREAISDEIAAAMGEEVAAWERAYEKASLYSRNLVPDANRALDATLHAYQAGRADFTDLYRAELRLLEFERALIIAETATRIHRSSVEVLAGSPVDSQQIESR